MWLSVGSLSRSTISWVYSDVCPTTLTRWHGYCNAYRRSFVRTGCVVGLPRLEDVIAAARSRLNVRFREERGHAFCRAHVALDRKRTFAGQLNGNFMRYANVNRYDALS